MPSCALQYDVYRVAAPLGLGLLAALLVATLGRSRRDQGVTLVYTLFLIASLGYLATNYLEMISGSEAGNLFWSRAAYYFIAPMPIIWLDFCLRFTREGRGLPKALILPTLLVPAATLVIVSIPGLSYLMWNRIEYFSRGRYVMSVRSHGPWFAAYALYTYGLFIAGAVVAIRAFAHYRSFYRRQSSWILAGIAIPLAASLVYVLRPFPSFIKDYTPLGYALSALLFYVALFHRGIFSIAPVGRATVVERLAEGVLVFDREGRLADANPAAMRIVGLGEDSLGKGLDAREGDGLSAAIASGDSSDVNLETAGGRRSYRVESSLLDEGRLVVITDQTELRDLLLRVESLALRDELTGLPNRRSFMSDAERELARSRRRGLRVSAAMIDFDGFKRINDEMGHASGDAVLRAFGSIVAEELRAEDLIGRMGGDEFAVLAVGGAEAIGIRSLCERLRARLASADIRDESGRPIGPSISAGIAAFDEASMDGLEKLLAAADAALYEAKRGGRNKVVALGEKPGA